MGGWNYKGKREADGLLSIHAKNLRKKNFFKNSQHGIMSWTNSWTGKSNSIGLQTEMSSDDNYLRIYYTQTPEDGDKQDFDYKVPIISTNCRYGGKRYWFLCPLSVNGVHCGRRIGVLYKSGVYFGCRKCHRLTYTSQNQSGKYKGFVSEPDLEKAYGEIKRWHYRDSPTRQYRKYLRLNEKFETGLAYMYLRLKKML